MKKVKVARTERKGRYKIKHVKPQCNVDPANPDTIPKFVDRLPVPRVLDPVYRSSDTDYYIVRMRQVRRRLHRYFPLTTVWGYEGRYPGPTIETVRDRRVKVKWLNQLPDEHLLTVDRTIHGAVDTPEVRTVVHLHGANVAAESDGYPEAWFTRDFRQTGRFFSSPVYTYTNHQQAATLWYHDHAFGITRLNVYAGLAGFYIIRDALEPTLNLPSGRYEIPLLIQDKSFNSDGSLSYPTSIAPIFFGNTILVNGKVWPYLEVEPRKYRFRILNASNSRTYTLGLSSGQPFYQIGSDGGLLGSPVELQTITVMPAERVDVIVDFSSEFNDQEILMTNGDPGTHTGQIMLFKVTKRLRYPDTSIIPKTLYPVRRIPEALTAEERFLTLDATTDELGRPMLILDGRGFLDPVSQEVKRDSIEIWNLINLTQFPHPIHVHQVQFQVLGRQPFDVEKYRNTGVLDTASEIPPAPNEMGWKDTVQAPPGQVTRIIAQFSNFTGQYVWHCHILEHEDYDMMRPFRVVP